MRILASLACAVLLVSCRSTSPAPRLDALFTDLHARGLFRRITKDDYASLTGAWQMPGGETLLIDRDARHLFITRNSVRYLMVQIDPKAFYVPGLDFIAGFTDDRLYVSTNLGISLSAPRASPSMTIE
jgi:hypothetical protein